MFSRYSFFARTRNGVLRSLKMPAVISLAFFVVFSSIPHSAHAAFGDGAPTVFNPNIFTNESKSVLVA